MRIPSALTLIAFGLLALILLSITSAFAAGISVPASNVGQQSLPITAEDVRTPACGALHLTNIVSGSGVLTGSAGNDLIVGSAGADTIDGLGGDDCILAGSGDDLITGGEGVDICVGGPGTDTFTTCETETQ